MSWIEELEVMESDTERDGIKIEEGVFEEKKKEEEATEEIKSLDDVLMAIDGCFDSLGVLIELKNLGEDVSEGFDIVEERMNDLKIYEEKISNILNKYERMTGFKTNKM